MYPLLPPHPIHPMAPGHASSPVADACSGRLFAHSSWLCTYSRRPFFLLLPHTQPPFHHQSCPFLGNNGKLLQQYGMSKQPCGATNVCREPASMFKLLPK